MSQRTTLVYGMEQEAVLAHFDTRLSGLSEHEAVDRLHRFGHNLLEVEKKISLFQRVISQMKNVMVLILTIAAGVALLVGDLKSALIVAAVIIMNTILGVVQENKADKAIDSLKKLASPEAVVLRDGYEHIVKAETLVPGDVVLLEAGNLIPADLRLVETINLRIEEAALTGESVPVEKDSLRLPTADASLGDQCNMAFTGTSVVYGRGAGIVVRTGMETEIGKIATLLTQHRAVEQTPLQKRLAEMSKYISLLIVFVCAVIFLTGILWGRSIFEMFLTAVSLAVAAIPEGLPAIVTIILALGVQKMAGKHAIVRRLPAVETLGSTQVICSDKTGTLTRNEMTVVDVYALGKRSLKAESGTDSEARSSIDDASPVVLLQAMTMCNDAKHHTMDGITSYIGDPTETALLKYAKTMAFDMDRCASVLPRVAEVPFDSSRKMMSTVHRSGDLHVIYAKGALEVVLDRCNRLDDGRGIRKMDAKERIGILDTAQAMAHQALRVIAFAYRTLEVPPHPISEETVETDLVFLGMVGMIDPARPEAAEAVKVCRLAGIRPVMITGDHLETARAIAGELGILEPGDLSLEGKQLERMTDDELDRVIATCSVYARVSPEHKVRIVKAWRRAGKVTAMTGDGVNDAPALREANISIGMGITGTDVAKGVSDIILVDDNFATIVSAVEEGRKIFHNIKKVIHFLLSTHFGEVVTLFVATLFNWVILYPVHLLWVNLIIDTLPALALGMGKSDDRLMRQPPISPDSKLFAGGLGFNILLHGIMKGILVLAAFLWARESFGQEVGVTAAFATLGLVQVAHAFSIRSSHEWSFSSKIPFNKYLFLALLGAVVLQVAVIAIPVLNGVFNVRQLSVQEWIVPIVASLLIVPLVDLQKWLGRVLGRK